jgi:hypothetical protein
MASMLLISHADGRAYAVTAADFRKGADDEYKGFKIEGHEDGTPVEGPKTAAGVVKAQDAPKAPERATDAKKDGSE